MFVVLLLSLFILARKTLSLRLLSWQKQRSAFDSKAINLVLNFSFAVQVLIAVKVLYYQKAVFLVSFQTTTNLTCSRPDTKIFYYTKLLIYHNSNR